MPNTREKLIELLEEIACRADDERCQKCEEQDCVRCAYENVADHLIASGFIEELQNEAYDVGVDSALHNKFGLSWEDAAGLRKEIKRLQDAARWIPVTERLPENTGRYLTANMRANDERCVFDLWFDCGEWYIDENDDEFIYKVTHWMPLPEPPKGD